MVSIWIIIGLVISAICVSSLGAAFSVVGLGALFSGAVVAVWAMAGSLELSKFVLAAYLHQRWKHINAIFKWYLTFAVVTLSLITSMGIFGFLSDAYQSASHELDEQNLKISIHKNKQNSIAAELHRLNKSIDEIPANRVTRRLKAREEMEPAIQALNKESDTIEKEISDANLKIHEIKKKIGPLIYISRAFNRDVDLIVKYLIFVFVLVFDPLAICLVIATSEALNSRRRNKRETDREEPEAEPLRPQSPSVATLVTPPTSEKKAV